MIPRPLTRAALSDAIEAAIAALDVIDGEPDLEPDNEDGCYAEDNPLIGKPDPYVKGGEMEDDEPSLCGVTVDPWHLRKHHDDGDREGPDDDAEPTLGSIAANCDEHQGNWWRGRNTDGEDEPSLGSPEGAAYRQTLWASGGNVNEREMDADYEHDGNHGAWGHPPNMPLVHRDCIDSAYIMGERVAVDTLPADWVPPLLTIPAA